MWGKEHVHVVLEVCDVHHQCTVRRIQHAAVYATNGAINHNWASVICHANVVRVSRVESSFFLRMYVSVYLVCVGWSWWWWWWWVLVVETIPKLVRFATSGSKSS